MAQRRGGAGPAGSSISAATGYPFLRSVVTTLISLVIIYQLFMRAGPLPAFIAGGFLVKLGFLRVPHLSVANGTDSNFAEMLRRSDVNSAPIVEKHGAEAPVKDGTLQYGYSCMQGWRRTMEDAHLIAPELGGDHSVHFFGVFDGHSGCSVAQYCGANLPRFLLEAPSFGQRRYTDALKESFVNIDRHLHSDPAFTGDKSGCTAVTLLVTATELYCANAGDSRCVLCRDGKPVALSNDHKPNLPAELRRIQRARGFVWNRRVNGVLALSRAIGDFAFKNNPTVAWEEQAVTCFPEVTQVTLDRKRDEFVVIACDGIWDVKTNEEVVSFVRSRLQTGMGPREVAERLMDDCLATSPLSLGCDNMSVVVIVFRHAQPSP